MTKKQFNAKLKKSTSIEEKISIFDCYAEELFCKGKFTEAAEIYEQAYRTAKQQNVKAYFAGQTGICHYNNGDDGKALTSLNKSLRLFEPGKPEFMPDMYGFVAFHLGSLYEYHGKTAKSLEARKKCEAYFESQEKETQWMLYAGLSRNYEVMGRHTAAIMYSQKAIQVLSDNDPGLSYLYESMANNYLGLQQYQEAINHFSKVLELDRNFERRDEIHAKMAECYHQLANYAMAIETYAKILNLKELTETKQSLIGIYLKIAECHFRMESFEKSLLFALETLHRNPRNTLEKAEARSYLTNNYYELGRYKEAVEEGVQTIALSKRFPNDDLFYVRLALSYHKLGNRRSFLTYRSLFKKLFPDDNWNRHLDKLA
ncbi:MAG TPA: tetratricopeptide repeat protein [Acidobacteriota bacterium]|nr:tetratricopeptide repeat protein [Acidobacteriota bacterium]